jgi:hypothetical protein
MGESMPMPITASSAWTMGTKVYIASANTQHLFEFSPDTGRFGVITLHIEDLTFKGMVRFDEAIYLLQSDYTTEIRSNGIRYRWQGS